ncbi:TonB-dependent receptor [bacterium]|nr:TonB-dependent receptor [bacterium]
MNSSITSADPSAIRRSLLLLGLCLLTFWVSVRPAGAKETGSVSGTVIDAQTKEPLPGVNIVVKGTYLGAATDMDGRYFIPQIPAGDFIFQVSMIGYTIQQKTSINVLADQTSIVDFTLEPTTLALGQEITVIGEKPLMELDITSSSRNISAAEIQAAMVEDVSEVVGQQLGVVDEEGALHIRGGRSHESLFMVDGVAIRDPLSGNAYGLHISADAVAEIEVITGGFNAEYGQAMSGVVQIKTREGGSHYHGSATMKSDHILGLDYYNTDILELNLRGPEPILSRLLPGDVTFMLNGYSYFSDTYLPNANHLYSSQYGGTRFCPREENDWSGLAKLTWKIKPTHKLSASYNRSLKINQGYFSEYGGFPYRYSKHLDNFNTYTQEAIGLSVNWSHTTSPTTFYELILSRFFSHLHYDVAGKHWSQYIMTDDQEPVVTDTSGQVQVGDGFYDWGDSPYWHDHYVETYTIKGDLTSQISQRHQIKAGLELSTTEMQLVDIYKPWLGQTSLGLNHDLYHVYPNSGSFYIQDKIVYEGMIINLGLRYDYWFPGEFVEQAINDPETVTISDAARQKFYDETFEIFGHRGKGHLSPRLGISHPISDNDMLFLSYGHFSQLPKYQYIYAKLKSRSMSTYQLFGNPNLNSTVTVAYEMGIKHKFSEKQMISLTAFYKDIFDYPTSLQVEANNPRLGDIYYLMYFNMDFARSRGVEIELKRRQSHYLSGTANFSYSMATGKSSTPDDALLVAAGRLREKTLKEDFLNWDKPILFSLNITFRIGEHEHPRLFGLKLPDNWSVNLRYSGQSGKRYRPVERKHDANNQPYDDYGERNANVGQHWAWLDLKIEKDLHWRSLWTTFFLEGKNVLDNKNARYINPLTGRAWEQGDPIPISWANDPNDLPPWNPARYKEPRSWRAGMSVSW